MTGRRSTAAIAACAAVAVSISGSCVDPAVQSPGAQAPRPAADQPIVLDEGSAAAAAPAATPHQPRRRQRGSRDRRVPRARRQDRERVLRSVRGAVERHPQSRQRLLQPRGRALPRRRDAAVEAPDHGHETTSEAYSYWLWLEAAYGKVTRDWSYLNRAWKNMERYIIPTLADQPTNMAYTDRKPATYAPEGDTPAALPVAAEQHRAGRPRPAGAGAVRQLRPRRPSTACTGSSTSTTGTASASAATAPRGRRTSTPSSAGRRSRCGRRSRSRPATTSSPAARTATWTCSSSRASRRQQWKYTDAPDADARAIQAAYWAKTWADKDGGSPIVADLAKAAKMGDYLRYAMFDKYFKTIGLHRPAAARPARTTIRPTTCCPGTTPGAARSRSRARGRCASAPAPRTAATRTRWRPTRWRRCPTSSPSRRTRRATGSRASTGSWSSTAGCSPPRAASRAARPTAGTAATSSRPPGRRRSTAWPTTRRPSTTTRRATSGSGSRRGRWSASRSTTT